MTENVALSVCLFYVSRELSQIFCSAVKEVKTRSTSQDGETTTQQLYHFNDFELDQYYVDFGKEEISVNATEALVTVGRIWQVVNIVVATVEHLDWGWIVLGVA